MHVPFNDLRAHHASLQPALGEAIQGVIDSCDFIRGKEVELFEKEFAQAVGTQRCISTANGTDSLYIAMKALSLQAGDEVITTAHSWISTSETITQAGGKVVFCDTEPDTFTIDPADIARKVTSRTKGIIPVHLYGQPADMDPILEIAQKHGLWVIEDCAQAHLAEYKGRQVGTLGDIGTFSFYPGKNLGAMGDAGCIVTNNDKLAEWMELYARHGGKGEHSIEGINSRMDGIQGAILRVKLPHLRHWTALRQKVARRYDEALAGIPGLIIPTVAPNRTHAYHLYVIRTENRDALRSQLNKDGVITVLNYPVALPFLPAYKHLYHHPADFPNAYANQSRILSIPIYPELTEPQIKKVTNSIRTYSE